MRRINLVPAGNPGRVRTAHRGDEAARGCIANDVIDALWPAQVVGGARGPDFDRAVHAVDQHAEAEEAQEVWEPIRRENR